MNELGIWDLIAVSTMNDYQDIIDNLPKPYSAEEQYLYSIACVVAEVPYEIPFQNAFWRKEQYFKAIWQIAIEKVAEPTIPSDETVTTDKIIDKAITEIKLAQEVTDKLLGDDRITTSMLQDNSVSTEKIVDGAVTLIKLAKEVVDKLLADDKIETSMIKDLSITTEKLVNNAINSEKIAKNTIILSNLSKEVTNLLLTTNHVGIIQQPQINQITESGDMLTLDVLKNKINEIIQLLNNAEITK